MKYRIIEAGGKYLAEKKGWLFWSEVCYRGWRFTRSSALADIRLDKAMRNSQIIYEEG